MSGEPLRPAALSPGARLDRYELLCPLAMGGMGAVWVARLRGKHGFEKLVAIKTILPEHAADARFRQMFLDEARIASRIEHGNVTRILDLGEERDVLYLVMEWVEGEALSTLQHAARKAKTPFPIAVAVRIVMGACAGLHAAHELCDKEGKPLNVVHRDVSPQNVLLSDRGEPKIIDFGIAKARDRVTAETMAGAVKGKAHYMAPEQAMGLAMDRRADVWSAGATLYSLLTGRSPFDADSEVATLHRLASREKPPPLPRDVPPHVAAAIAKALEHDVEARYPTALAFHDALEAAMRVDGLHATDADVAAFAAPLLARRTETRKRALDFALAAAAERERVERILDAVSDGRIEALPAFGASRASTPTLADVPGARARRERVSDAGVEHTGSSLSAATLGPLARRRSGRGRVPALLAIAGLGVAALMFVVGRGRGTVDESLARTTPRAASSPEGAPTPPAAAPSAEASSRPPVRPDERASPVLAAPTPAAPAPSVVAKTTPREPPRPAVAGRRSAPAGPTTRASATTYVSAAHSAPPKPKSSPRATPPDSVDDGF